MSFIEHEIRTTISIKDFEFIIKTLNELSDSNYISKKVSRTIDFIYDKDNNSKKIMTLIFNDEGKKEEINYQIKKRLESKKIEINNFNFKYSKSEETKIKDFSDNTIKMVRIKIRISIVLKKFPDWRYDITAVKEFDYKDKKFDNNFLKTYINDIIYKLEKVNDGYQNILIYFNNLSFFNNFELEAEYIGEKNFEFSEKELYEIISYFIKGQISNYEFLKEIAIKLKIDISKGLTIKKITNQVTLLTKQIYYENVRPNISNYFITDKIDGMRCIAVLEGNKEIIITNTNAFIFDLDTVYINTTIYEGEFINNKVWVFDVLMYHGTDVRDQEFSKRKLYFEQISRETNRCIVKDFLKLSSDFSEEIEKFVAIKRNYHTDGIIFQSMDGNYYDDIYKWKPAEQQTIDFLIRKPPPEILGRPPYLTKQGHELYILFCGVNIETFSKNDMQFIKCYDKLFKLPDKKLNQLSDNIINISNKYYFPIQFSPPLNSLAHIYYHPISENQIGDLDMHIGEFSYNFLHPIYSPLYDSKEENSGIWKLLRLREDREIDAKAGNYFGNDYSVANSIFTIIFNPLTLSNLISKNTNSYFSELSSDDYKAERNYGSFIKSSMHTFIAPFIKKYLEGTEKKKSICDLAAGKGQDLIRYSKLNYKVGLFMDIDADALSELIRRVSNIVNPMKIFVRQADLKINHKILYENLKTDLILERYIDLQFDVVSCNFAIHYFCESEGMFRNFIKFVDSILAAGGYFLFTCFSGLEVLRKILSNDENKNEKEWTKYENDKKKYSIKLVNKFVDILKFGQKIDVLLPFSNGNYYTEYLVNFNEIFKILRKSFNYEIEFESFSTGFEFFKDENPKVYKMLTDIDKEYLSLYHYVICKKPQKKRRTTKNS